MKIIIQGDYKTKELKEVIGGIKNTELDVGTDIVINFDGGYYNVREYGLDLRITKSQSMDDGIEIYPMASNAIRIR